MNSRFNEGKPLSCFRLKGGDKCCVHIAVKNTRRENINYLTFNFKPSSKPKKEAGMHFCLFEFETGVTEVAKKDLDISSYAIMLPYIIEDSTPRFKQQYTLIYHDWDVLRADLVDKNYKGCSSVSNSDFRNLITELK